MLYVVFHRHSPNESMRPGANSKVNRAQVSSEPRGYATSAASRWGNEPLVSGCGEILVDAVCHNTAYEPDTALDYGTHSIFTAQDAYKHDRSVIRDKMTSLSELLQSDPELLVDLLIDLAECVVDRQMNAGLRSFLLFKNWSSTEQKS